MSRAPETVGVIGGGRMGAGIAQVFAQAGSRVTVVERDPDSAKAAGGRLDSGIAKAAARNPDIEIDRVRSLIEVSTEFGDLESAQVVIEAVPENHEMKVDALAKAESVIDPSAWLTTNTSSLSVERIARELQRPERFCGLHFFNPVPPSALVELVVTDHTLPELREQAKQWVDAIGKTAIVVHDAPGFASSRLGVALALEAMRMLDEGVASAEDIDAAMTLGYRHAAGPLRTTDIVGLDVRLGIAEYLHETLGERFAPPQILRDKVAAGDLGRKSGRGFFVYPSAT